MRQNRKAFAAALAVAALALSACGSGSDDTAKVADKPSFEAGTTMATISAAGTMKVGTKFDQPGFGLKGLDGKLAGFDVEVAKITAPADLKANPDQKVCSVTGSTPAEQIKPFLADPAQLVLFDVYDKCANSLRTDQVQVVTTDNVILLGFVSKSDKAFKLIGEQFTKEPYGIGLKKGDVKFCEFINTTLKENEAAYTKAWADTAGTVEGAAAATLPEPAPCS